MAELEVTNEPPFDFRISILARDLHLVRGTWELFYNLVIHLRGLAMSILLGRLLLTMSFTIMTMACSDKVSQTASNSSIYGTWFMDDMVIDGKSAQFDDGKGNSLKVNKEFSITLAKDEIIFSKLCQSNKKFSKKAAAVISSTRIELLGRVDTSCEGNGDEVWQNIVWEVIKIDEATLHTSDDLDSGYIVWKRR